MTFERDTTYTADHGPTGETWHIIGVDIENGKVCAAGYPPTLANLDDCSNFRDPKPRTADEEEYMYRHWMSDSWL